jgi:preprotein translocase SecF subunit
VLNLVKYRYIFIAISLLVIIPGLISLGIFGLHVGIDFKGGADTTIRPQSDMTREQVTKLLDPLKLADLIVIGPSENKNLAANKTVWVRLNVQVDNTVQKAITDRLTQKTTDKDGKDVPAKYPEAKVDFKTIPGASGEKAFTLVTITGFKDAPKLDDVKALFKDLPKTSDPTKGDSTSTLPSATTTAQATTTPQATATAAPTATPAATATSTSSSSNPANIDVSFTDVLQGKSTQTYTIRYALNQSKGSNQTTDITNKIQSQFLSQKAPYFQVLSSQQVGPSVATETTRNAILAIVAISIFILGYIWLAFRKVPHAIRYGTCAVIALLHDALLVLGVFSILGYFLGIQVDSLFITALLTVIGFSVHDTIVVFDRIRENLTRRGNETFPEVVNASLVQTMARSLNTSLTVLFTLLALTMFTTAGTSVHNFTLALLIGIFSGTYSSIFNASMLLVIWDNGEMGFGAFRKRRDERISSKRESREFARAR